MKKLFVEFKRFTISGISTVLLDILAYSILLNLSMNINISKGISFLVGTLYAYFINKKWTFEAVGGGYIFIKFLFIYLISLSINITLNRYLINTFEKIILAFFISTIASALFNFICLKKIVFNKKKKYNSK